MSWNDSNLEARASNQNPDSWDRAIAQADLADRKRLMAEEMMRQQGINPAPAPTGFFKGFAGYLGLLFLAVIFVAVLSNPAEFAANMNFQQLSPVSMWWTMTIGFCLMLFIALTMTRRRASGSFLKRLFRRAVFTIIVSGIASAILVIRMLTF